MDVAVVILNYNGKPFLEQFLPGVVEHSENATVWVVDNNSIDHSVQYVKDNFPTVKLLINEENGGFAKGYNDGLKKIEAEYYVLLNSDVEVTENWIQPCIDLLESDPTIAAVQPKILAQKEQTKFEHAGAAGGFLDKNYYPFCRGRLFDHVETDEGQYNDDVEVFWATGACLFVRSEVYHANGGLDEKFFAHMEEIDFCWRIKSQGHKIFACGGSTVYHVGGGTLNYMNPRKTFLNFRNSLFMIFKNHPGPLLPKLFWRMVIDGIAAALFLVKFQFRHFWAVFRSHIAVYANWGSLSKQRKALKQSATAYNSTGLYKKSIITQKFLKGVKSFNELSPKDFH